MAHVRVHFDFRNIKNILVYMTLIYGVGKIIHNVKAPGTAGDESASTLASDMKICEQMSLHLANELPDMKSLNFSEDNFAGLTSFFPHLTHGVATKVRENEFKCETDNSRKVGRQCHFQFSKDRQTGKHTTATREMKKFNHR